MLIIAIPFLSISLEGQNKKEADSLLVLLNQNPLNDSLKLILLDQIATKVSSPDDANYYAKQLLDLAKEVKSNRDISNAYHYLGVSERRKGDLSKSLEYLFKSAEIAENNNFQQILGETYLEIAATYTQNQDPDNSLLYKAKAIDVIRETGDSQVLAINLLNTGYTYYSINNLDTALAYYNEAEPIFEEIGLEIGKAYTIGNRALVYWKQGDLKTAKKDLLKSIDMLKPLGDQYGMADYYNQLGNISLEQNQSKEAITYTEIGLEMAKAEDLKEQVRDASLLLSTLYKEQRDYEKSLNYQEQYIAYKDSIQDQETTQRLADLRTDFEVGQKQAEVDLLSVQKRNQQLVSVGLGAILLLTGVFAFIIFRNYREKNRINKLLESQAIQLQDQKTELERLNDTKDKFFSIISHDLRGPVSSFMGVSNLIKFYTERDDKKNLLYVSDLMSQSVDSLSSLLDDLLNWAMQQQGHFPNVPEKILLKKLVQTLLETFVNMANAKQINLDSTIEDEIELWGDKNSIHTILRNLTNNSLKFTPDGGEIVISATIEDRFAKISVKDSGVGMPNEKVENIFKLDDEKSTYGTSGEKGLGLGLQLVKEFVEMNNGSISVNSEEGVGTEFIIELPLFERSLVENRSVEIS